MDPQHRGETLAEKDQRYVWHPFTPMQVWLEGQPLVIERGEGCELIDTDGRRYIDGVSSLWVNVHGHGHPKLDAALKAQIDRLAHSTFLGLSHPGAIELAERLVAISPDGLDRVFFSENGAAAVEVALKMAYSYWRNLGQERPRFVRLQNAYHGDTIGAVSIGGIERFHDTFRPLLFATEALPSPYCYRCPLDKQPETCGLACAEALEDLLRTHGDQVAAVVVEPLVQGAAGIITAPDGHLRRIAEITRRHGTLLLVDEVATGFGRTGTMFACEHEDVQPDIMCLAKGITGGYLPLSATLASERVFAAFLAAPEAHKTLYHGHSYAANPLCCAAALANLEVFAEEGTLDALQPKIELLEELLEPLRGHPHVGEVRQRGFMVGIELVVDRASKQGFEEAAQTGVRVIEETRKHGVIIRNLGDVLVLMPPLAISPAQLRSLVEAVQQSIETVTSQMDDRAGDG